MKQISEYRSKKQQCATLYRTSGNEEKTILLDFFMLTYLAAASIRKCNVFNPLCAKKQSKGDGTAEIRQRERQHVLR
jgi:hypothetical protein